MSERACGGCIWYDERPVWDGGGCYRFPPDAEGRRPAVEFDTPACGEWDGENEVEFTPDEVN